MPQNSLAKTITDNPYIGQFPLHNKLYDELIVYIINNRIRTTESRFTINT